MFERLEKIPPRPRAVLAILTVVGVGAMVANKVRKPSVTPKETLVAGLPFTYTQFERAGNALVPFVHEWKLGLNPENLDLMVYAVLKHASSPQGLETSEDYQNIEDDVQSMIAEDKESHKLMHEAWQREIDNG